MDPTVPYLACVAGAAALYVLLRPGQRAPKIAAALVGLALFAWILVSTAEFVGARDSAGGESNRPEVFFVIFSVIAVASAVRMITHPRPVYSALYFVMVVLSSAALFLLLEAEFMAFALVIVYAGAILITYMFVLMLAQQTPQEGQAQVQPEYDAVAREPGYAAAVGFIMLAVMTRMIFSGVAIPPPQMTVGEARLEAYQALEHMPSHLREVVRRVDADAELKEIENGRFIRLEGDQATVHYTIGDSAEEKTLVLTPEMLPTNVQRVGLDLVAKFPVSLELAGIILLMAMFGAVVLARKQIELGEDEIREAAGMRRLDFHAEESAADLRPAPKSGGPK